MQKQRDIFRQLAPFYSRTEEKSLDYLEDAIVVGSVNSFRFSGI